MTEPPSTAVTSGATKSVVATMMDAADAYRMRKHVEPKACAIPRHLFDGLAAEDGEAEAHAFMDRLCNVYGFDRWEFFDE